MRAAMFRSHALSSDYDAAARFIEMFFEIAVSPPPLGGWPASVNDDIKFPQRPTRSLDVNLYFILINDFAYESPMGAIRTPYAVPFRSEGRLRVALFPPSPP